MIVIAEQLETAVVGHCSTWSPLETGGIVLGARCAMGTIHAAGFSGPGPRARHGRSSFVRDGEHAQEILDDVFRRSVGRVDYVGEWHSHPKSVAPSDRDARSVAWIASNGAYGCAAPLLIVPTRMRKSWVLKAFQYRDQSLVLCDVVRDCGCDLSVDIGMVIPNGNQEA